MPTRATAFYLFSPFLGDNDEYEGGGRDWVSPLTFTVLGFLLVVLGLVLARRRGAPVAGRA